MTAYHTMTCAEAEEALSTDLNSGLSDKEADERLRRDGANVLRERGRKSILSMFFEQLNDFMIIILLCAAAVSFFSAFAEMSENGGGIGSGLSDPIIILAIVLLNAVVGVIQEVKAQKSLDALKKLAAPKANVVRGGKMRVINAEDLVKGDVVAFSAGDIVGADCRIISAVRLSADESALTGESAHADKDSGVCKTSEIPLGDRRNMLYASSSITRGTGRAVVTATGMDTEMGHIASMLMEENDEKTPLQKKLAAVGKTLGIAALLICAAVFAVGILKRLPPMEMFMTSVSLAVAAIPEGLTAIVTITLALGVTRISKRGAIVRRLPSVETLGSASVICSDKTGTITENKMKAVYASSADEKLLFEYAAICTEDNTRNPTENAIINAARERGITFDKTGVTDILPFDSDRKYMAVKTRRGGQFLTVAKGACEVILKKCSKTLTSSGETDLTSAERRRIRRTEENAAKRGLRVIAAAYKRGAQNGSASGSGYVFLGLIGIEDPPRREAVEAVAVCRRAGIIPVMITGDHADTARTIAERCGIFKDGDTVMTGAQLDKTDDNELLQKLDRCRVFARVSPAHKVRIVRAWQKRGEIVAMTGDGVNDAPALKAADIGCGMGSGVEVAKDASDMILSDDNFATIVVAVREGREIFANIKKAVQFLLSSNIGEILTVFAGLLFGFAAPLTASQLLWVNLVTDSLPAISLGLDKCEDDIMEKPPVRGGIFSGGLWAAIIFEGLLIGALSLTAFTSGMVMTGSVTTARTMAFAVLSLSQLVHAFNMRSDGSVIKGMLSNKYLDLSFAAGVLLEAAVISLPACAPLFGVTALSAPQWIITAALSVMPLAVVEAQKRINAALKR